VCVLKIQKGNMLFKYPDDKQTETVEIVHSVFSRGEAVDVFVLDL